MTGKNIQVKKSQKKMVYHNLLHLALIILLSPIIISCAPSIVYNFRVAQTTRQPIGKKGMTSPISLLD